MRKITHDQFIKRALEVHGDKYDFCASVYNGMHNKVVVGCKDHGDFLVTPANLVKGKGCRDCYMESKVTPTAVLVERFREVHGDKYDYSFVDSKEKKVRIDCRLHGSFYSRKDQHLAGHGCTKCSRQLTGQEYVDTMTSIHGDKYLYPETNIVSSTVKVKVICRVHGEFLISPSNLKQGSGCHKCAKTGFQPSRTGTFYTLVCRDVIKVGITNRSLKTRLNEINRHSPYKFEEYESISGNGYEIQELEKKVLTFLRSRYKGVSSVFDGSTECFKGVDLNILSVMIHK